jgi:hypothetical protein
MKRYGNLSGDSGVVAYETGDDWITVEFRTGGVYRYDYDCNGRANIERMKRLASSGRGLAAYINKNLGGRYAARLR